MRKILFNARGLRAGWRLLIFVGIFVGLGFLSDWIIPKIFHPKERSFLDPVDTIWGELQTLIQVLIATWIMARIERRASSITAFQCATPSEASFGSDLSGARLPLLCWWA
jgi:hypothetical protein